MADLYREHPSLTARYADGDAEPHPASASADTVVWLALPPESDRPQVWEGLRAQSVDAVTVRLAAVPLFAYDVHFGDEMSVMQSAEGALVATGIVRRAHSRTFRAWLEGKSSDVPDLSRRFGEMGCLVERYSDSLIGFGCAIELAPKVAEMLTLAEQDNELIWESGQQ